jgi:serine/threonine protein kinase
MYKNGTVYNNASALAWMRHVAEGLRYLHNAKPQVVHRDLKLENVLMRSVPLPLPTFASFMG